MIADALVQVRFMVCASSNFRAVIGLAKVRNLTWRHPAATPIVWHLVSGAWVSFGCLFMSAAPVDRSMRSI